MDPFIGQIMLFGGTFAPRGWADCAGQLLSISENTALFSLLGTTYGGDGRTTFGLPDLRGRVVVGLGTGPGLQDIKGGQKGGTASTTLQKQNLPSIPLSIPVSEEGPTVSDPNNAYLAAGNFYSAAPSDGTQLGGGTDVGGSSVAMDNHQPYLGLRYVIALVGIFPPRP